MRTRAFVQDDAHVFCREDDVGGEVARFAALLRGVYAGLGFPAPEVALSTRPAARAGDDATWDRAEATLAAAAEAAGLAFSVSPGEGAFYGPKLEFALRDRQGRSWQCGTVQLDFVLPGRLGAEYVAPDGGRKVPVMIHHAVLGSLERFVGILLEHHGGALPFWLAPDQVAVLPVSRDQADYAAQVAARLEDLGVRAVLDASAETLPRRIVSARAKAVPVMAVVGRREAAAGTVAVRTGEGEPVAVPLDALSGALPLRGAAA